MISQLRTVSPARLMIAQFRLQYLHYSSPEWNVIRHDGVFFTQNGEEKLLSGNFSTTPRVFVGCAAYQGRTES